MKSGSTVYGSDTMPMVNPGMRDDSHMVRRWAPGKSMTRLACSISHKISVSIEQSESKGAD